MAFPPALPPSSPLLPRPPPSSPLLPGPPARPTAGTVLQFFSCQQLGDNFFVLRYSQTTECFTPDYEAFRPYAIVCVLLYPVGVPLLFLGWLWRLVRTQQLGNAAARARYGFLYQSYTRQYWVRAGPGSLRVCSPNQSNLTEALRSCPRHAPSFPAAPRHGERSGSRCSSC